MHEPGVRPARPHTGFTEDGRRLAEVLSYTRRGSRLSDRQTRAWERHVGRWWIPDGAVDDPGFRLASWFDRDAPLIVEIGSGGGEATSVLAAARPSYNILAFEVWRPGLAETFRRLEEAGADNVRTLSIDAVWAMEHLLDAGSVEELWTFFPDPWPKRRHQRRRLVTPPFSRVAASRLVSGGSWRLATDWPDYAEQMLEVLSGEPLLRNVHSAAAPRWDERPLTRFERRGVQAGRPVTDLTFERVPTSVVPASI
jgi:tRNA (guanine-N7-)-methyltransferase